MIKPPNIPGITDLQEIGRDSQTVGFKGDSRGVATVVEVLLTDNEETRTEFYRTSALQSRMANPGMPPIQYSGVSEGQPYRVREFVEGRPVSGLFSEGPLPKHRLIATGRALASTLSALHRRGMVHTEVHPHCLRIDSSGLIRFIDTGRGWPVLRPLPGCHRRTALAYQAPESSKGKLARTESDIFSLGAVLAALAVGKPAPAEGMTHDFLRGVKTDLSPALRVLLRSMLDKDPAKRPEAHTVMDCLSRIDQLDSLLRLRSWKPPTSANTFLGHHAYPLIGREKELSQLLYLWQKVTKGKGLSVTILGPKGSGRRRLVEELRRGVERSGGKMVRHRLDADPENPTLIVNYSHKGRQQHDADMPWLSVNFAETGPVPDQHTIELSPLTEAEGIQLAEAYLASPADEGMRSAVFSKGQILPADLLQQLDDWCEEGVLRPARGRWHFNLSPNDPETRAKPVDIMAPRAKELKLDYDKAIGSILDLWPSNLEQDDPLVAVLQSICTALKSKRADLYQVNNTEIRHGCASTFGKHRLDRDLLEKIQVREEPVWSTSKLLYPLKCGYNFCGFLSIEWYDEGVPEFGGKLFQLLSLATSPLALMLGQTQLQERRLFRITQALRDLLAATTEPSDILTQLASSFRRSLEFEDLSIWIVRESRLDYLQSDPPGEVLLKYPQEHDFFIEPFETEVREYNGDLLLQVPLVHDSELLGGIMLRRDPLTPFTKGEVGWADTLARVAEDALEKARQFGTQAKAAGKG